MKTQTRRTIQKLIEKIEKNLQEIKMLLEDGYKKSSSNQKIKEKIKALGTEEIQEEGTDKKIIKGIFDGQNMVGPEGQVYPIPPNYASKSKLIEGDVLKLTIQDDGSFIYKQIEPIARKKVIGTLAQDDQENFIVLSEGRAYRVLTASITYFKGELGDEVTIVLPKDKESEWAAVEGIIKNSKKELSLNDLKKDAPIKNDLEKQDRANAEEKPEPETGTEKDETAELPSLEDDLPKLETEEKKPELPAQDTEPQLTMQEPAKEEVEKYDEIEEI